MNLSLFKTYKVGNCELQIRGNLMPNGEVFVDKVIATVFHDDGEPKYFDDAVCKAFLSIEGVDKALSKMEWDCEEEEAREAQRRFYKPTKEIRLYEPPKVVSI